VFSTSNWATPHIFDLREPPLLLLQCERSFVLLDTNSGLQVGVGTPQTPLTVVAAVARGGVALPTSPC
jgi:hypothetical protein